LICTFLCVLFSISSYAQTNNQLFSHADALFARQQFYDASLSYERVVFETRDEQTRAIASVKKANCLKQLGQFGKATEGLLRINFGFLPDSLRFWCKYEVALCSYLEGNFTEAQFHLQQAVQQTKDSAFIEQTQFLELLVLNGMHKWDEAHVVALEMLDAMELTNKAELVAEIDELYSKRGIPKLKKEKTAGNWSTWIPGAGHAYAGKPLEGVFSMILNAATMTYLAFNILSANYVTAITINATLLQTFYFGGQKRAKYLVRVRNYKLIHEFNNKVKALFTGLYMAQLNP
jgi:tetratricopeptide (TPR) repeat protein